METEPYRYGTGAEDPVGTSRKFVFFKLKKKLYNKRFFFRVTCKSFLGTKIFAFSVPPNSQLHLAPIFFLANRMSDVIF